MKNKIKSDDVYKLDQFFTKENLAIECIEAVNKIFKLDDFDLIIEPSAGKGSFSNNLPVQNSVAIEIDKQLCNDNKQYKCLSFFDYKCPPNYKNVLVIGNPPFGTQNSLSVDFFNHAAEFANVIAFIIPRTWNKKSIHNRLDSKFILVNSFDVPEDCFFGDKKTSVKCCFQIWAKTEKDRPKDKKILKHADWEFLQYTKDEKDIYPPKESDFVILAYGSKSGQVSTDVKKWRPKSVHFIKSNIETQKLIDRFKSLDYSISNNSARQSSLCKSDLVKLYTEKYEK